MAEPLQLLIKSAFDASGVTAATNSVKSIDAQINKVSRGFSTMMKLMGAGGIGAAVLSFGKSAVNAYAESEAGVSKLAKAMQNLGSYSESALRDQLDYAGALQKTTKYSDEQVMTIQASLTTYGLYGDKLKAATLATLNLATQTGDSASAAKIVGKAYQGQTDTLGKMGIKISDTLVGTQKFDAVMAQLNKRFGGFAENEGKTFSGQLAIMTNRFDELKEKIGKELMPVANTWLRWVDNVTTKVEKLFSSDADNLKGLDLTILGLKEKIKFTTDYIRKANEMGEQDDEQTKKAITDLHKYMEALKRVQAQKAAQDARAPKDPVPGSGARVVDAELDPATAQWLLNQKNQMYVEYYQRRTQTEVRFNRNSSLTEQERARENKKILQDMEREWNAGSRTISGGFEQAFMEMGNSAANWRDNWIGVVNGAVGPAKSSIHDFFTSTSAGFMDLEKLAKGVFDGILKSFLNMLEEMAAKAAVYGMFNLLSGGSLGAATSLTKFLGFDNGGIMTAAGSLPLNKYSYGGIANSAQVAVYGEGRKPEAYVPLPDGRTIPVTMASGGGGNSLTIYQSITAGVGADVKAIFKAAAEGARKGASEFVDFARVSYKVGAKRSGETSL